MTRPSSEDAVSEQSYQPPVAIPVHSEQQQQYLIQVQQQPFYHPPQPTTPTHEFYPQQNLQMTHIAVQDPPPIVTQNIPVTSPVDVQQHVQQYMQLAQQYDPNPQNYLPPEFHRPPYTAQTMTHGLPIMVSYADFEYKPPTAPRILNQAEGTDWGFLGVG